MTKGVLSFPELDGCGLSASWANRHARRHTDLRLGGPLAAGGVGSRLGANGRTEDEPEGPND